MSPIQNYLKADTVKTTDAASVTGLNGEPQLAGEFAQMLSDSQASLPGQQTLPNEVLDLELVQLENALEVEDLALNSQLNAPNKGINPQLIDSMQLGTEPTPKLINSELIKQVQEVIAPGDIQQVQAMPEMKEGMTLKDLLMQQQQAQSKAARSPGTSFVKGEYDPKLLQFEDFVAQKNAVTAKNVNAQAYGMMNKNPVQVQELANSTDWALESAMPQSITGSTSDYVAPQAVYTMEAPLPAISIKAEMAPAAKVFDMNQMNNNQDVDSIITQVTDYIVQAKAAKEPTVTMKMQHQDLGLLDITVSRSGQNNVNVILGAQDMNTKMFLGQHREQLMSHLTQAGVGVSDLRFEQSAPSKDFSQSGHQQQHHSGQFGSQQNERNAEQERRHQLWELIREKEVA